MQLRGDRKAFRAVGSNLDAFEAIVVAGGGQFDDLFGGPFNHPYTLWQYARHARHADRPFLVLSVGTGSLRPMSTFFVRRVLPLSKYVSFRDERSRELVGDCASGLPVVPDLAYGLPLDDDEPVRRSSDVVVGISPMAFADPRYWPEPDVTRYRRHIHSLARLTRRLLEAGHRVTLFISDGPDRRALDDLEAELLPGLLADTRSRMRVAPPAGVRELMAELVAVDVVVAARLHGLLLAHLRGKPTLAIAHERKVATLMAEMALSRFCYDIDQFDADGVWQRMLELIAERDQLARDLSAQVAKRRIRVEAQYDQVFGAR